MGLCTVAVFGRSATLAMQRIRAVDGEAFDEWYKPWRKEMESDPLFAFFGRVRNDIIHGAVPSIGFVLASSGGSSPPVGSLVLERYDLPQTHRGQPITDQRIPSLARLYIRYLEEVFDSFAPFAFELSDKAILEKGPWVNYYDD